MTSWPCQYVNAKGEPCGSEAFFRYHFAPDHPFDHMDVCMEHSNEIKYCAWFQLLHPPIPKPDAGEEGGEA